MKQYTEIIDNLVEQYLTLNNEDAKTSFDFDKYTQHVTEEFQSETDFVDVMKELNQEIKDLKEVMKNALMKDYKIFSYPSFQ